MHSPAQGTGLFGREAELAEVDSAVAAAQAGLEVVALTGEPGIGKSALLAELAERAAGAGLSVLDGRAAEHERDVPFGLVVDALDDSLAAMGARRLQSLGEERLGELGAVLPAAAGHGAAQITAAGPAERFRYHRALLALLELIGGERPVALLLDDVHWADEASLEFILHLLRRPSRTPLLLAFAMRRTDPALRLLDALRSVPTGRLLALEPLPRAAALALLDGVADDALRERLHSEAGGNPLYLRELARVAEEGSVSLPPTLVAAVQLEVASLPPASRALFDGAAVAGDPFDPELAAAAAGLDPADAPALLDRLVALELVRPTDGRRTFRFRHPVVRRAVYDAIAPGWRLGAHERTAAALAVRGKNAVARAYHVEQAARPGDEAAIELLTAAARESVEASPATAARWYDAVLDLLPDRDPRVPELLPAMAGALGAAGRLEEARTAILKALDLLGEVRSPDWLALVAACAEVEHVLGRHADARQRLLEALEQLPAGAPPLERAGLELQLAVGALYAGAADALLEWAGRVLDTAGEDDAALATTAHALSALGSIWSMRWADAEPSLACAAALAERLADAELATRIDAFVGLTAAQLFAERFPAADAAAARGLAVSRDFHQDRLIAPLAVFRSMALANMCRLPEALQLAEAAEEAARMQGLRYQLMWALWQRAQMLDATGDGLEAQRAAGECLALIDTVEPSLVTRTGLCNLATLRLESDPEGSLSAMIEAGGAELEHVDPVWSTYLLRAMVQAALAADRLDEAESWASLIQERAARLALPAAGVRAATARAAVLLAAGQPGAAAELAARAAADADTAHATLDAIHARLVAGPALAAENPEAGVTELQRAGADSAAGGARKLRDAAARELRRLGVRLPAAVQRAGAAAGMAQLTPREREIVELAAAGRTNKEIAAALFLSQKTVESHLSRIFPKLGVRSRVELASLVARSVGG